MKAAIKNKKNIKERATNETTDKKTKFIAWLAILISLTGGIPGVVTSVKTINEKPKLNFIFNASFTSKILYENQDSKSCVLLIFSIGNRGKASFKRQGFPELEAKINDEWIRLQPEFTKEEHIERMPDDVIRNVITTLKIPDYCVNNVVIPANESVEVYLFATIDQKYLTLAKIKSAKEYKITLRDVKNRKYSQILERK